MIERISSHEQQFRSTHKPSRPSSKPGVTVMGILKGIGATWMFGAASAMGRQLLATPPASFGVAPPPPVGNSSLIPNPSGGGVVLNPINTPTVTPFNAMPATNALQETNIANLWAISTASICSDTYTPTGGCAQGNTPPPDAISLYTYAPSVPSGFAYQDSCYNIAPYDSIPNNDIAESCFYGDEGFLAALGSLDIAQASGMLSQAGHVGTTRYFNVAMFDLNGDRVTIKIDSKLPWGSSQHNEWIPFLSRSANNNLITAYLEKAWDRWNTVYNGKGTNDWTGSTGSDPTTPYIAMVGQQPYSYDAYSNYYLGKQTPATVIANLNVFAGASANTGGATLTNEGFSRVSAAVNLIQTSQITSRGITVGSATQMPDGQTSVTVMPNNILSCVDPSGHVYNIPAGLTVSLLRYTEYTLQYPSGTILETPEGFGGDGRITVSAPCLAAVASNIIYVSYNINTPNPGGTYSWMGQ